MLYLKSLTIDRFKSFKHAAIEIGKGFTCVVGPNGSGKSNVCDALLFGLGESSLGRFRVSRLEELIPDGVKKKKGEVSKSRVALEFAGESGLSISRIARSDGKTEYLMNGKRTTRQEMIEVLNSNGIRADETSTITQGEINRIISLNPKERRELIDIASGIKEFEAKKADALRELEKVGQRLVEAQAALGEKSGFLKELEREKEAAERYAVLTKKLKSLKYSVLVARKKALSAAVDAYTKEMAVEDFKRNDTEMRRSEIAKRLGDFDAERQTITHELSTGSSAMSETSTKLEEINRELVMLSGEISSQKNMLVEIGTFTSDSEGEIANIRTRISENLGKITELERRAPALENDASAYTPSREMDAGTGNMEALERDISALEREVESKSRELDRLRADATAAGRDAERAAVAALALRKKLDEISGSIAGIAKDVATLEKDMKSAREGIRGHESRLSALLSEISENDEKVIMAKEERAGVSARNGNMAVRVRTAFGKDKRFYGTAGELCTYDSERAVAIETAAGGRLDYFVVEDMAMADRIISFLKAERLGRATFIPLNELRVGRRDGPEKDAEPAIDAVGFDKALEKAFVYIFGNTYIVDSVEHARSIGIGKHRYVSIDGELIEQSGTVSGGYSKGRPTLAVVEKRIKELEAKRQELQVERKSVEDKLFLARKELARVELQLGAREQERRALSSSAASAEQSLKNEMSRKEALEKQISKAGELERTMSEALGKASSKLEALREEQRRTYNEAVATARNAARGGLSKTERERIEKAHRELGEIKAEIASTKKESEMLNARLDEINKAIEDRKESGKHMQKMIADREKRISMLEKGKRELELKIKSSGDANKKSYDRLSAINEEVEKLREENGRINAQLNEVDRRLGEVKMKRNQAETRLNDISAELSAYGAGIETVDGDADILDREAGVINARLNELGNVNLKAPELYEEKRKSVDETLSKIDTLEAERQAVLRMIEEIDSRKLQVFMSTFNEVNKNFLRLYNYLFTGKAGIELENMKDPFSGGVDIKVTEDGVNKVFRSMSGGQKSLILLMMLFAIHLCKPSLLYVFDEVDSALDKENSAKLSKLIKEMSKQAQFFVVSHNDSLIVNADTAIGVTKSGGESKVVGIEVSKIIKSTVK